MTQTLVGVSLLAIAVGQPQHCPMTHRNREQAHSYREMCVEGGFCDQA
jgi:hypothetical protein